MHSRPLLGALLLAALACGETRSAEPVAPVLVIGIDGLEWSVLRPLLADGRCPNLRGLMERGSFGYLATFVPTLSPVVWTSISTGKPLEEHGIFHFVDQKGRDFTSARRKGRAVWNIADRYGLTTNSFGWWITWPAEEIRGVMVSGSSSQSMVALNWKPALIPDAPNQVHPPELEDRVMALAERWGAEDHVKSIADERIFAGVDRDVLDDAEKLAILESYWSIQSDETFRRIALDLLPEHPADLNLVYFGGPDVVGHRFWRQYDPRRFEWQGSSPEADAALACVIPRYYEWIDEVVGELLAAVGDDHAVMVISDHGMHADPTKLETRPPKGITGNHQDAAPGVIVAAGPGIRDEGDVEAFLERGALPTLGTVLDVTPTLLALLGIPGSRGMNGRAYRPILEGRALENAKLPLVETHDDDFRDHRILEMPEDMTANFSERFQGLGYVFLQGGDETPTSRLVNPADVLPEGAVRDGPGCH